MLKLYKINLKVMEHMLLKIIYINNQMNMLTSSIYFRIEKYWTKWFITLYVFILQNKQHMLHHSQWVYVFVLQLITKKMSSNLEIIINIFFNFCFDFFHSFVCDLFMKWKHMMVVYIGNGRNPKFWLSPPWELMSNLAF